MSGNTFKATGSGGFSSPGDRGVTCSFGFELHPIVKSKSRSKSLARIPHPCFIEFSCLVTPIFMFCQNKTLISRGLYSAGAVSFGAYLAKLAYVFQVVLSFIYVCAFQIGRWFFADGAEFRHWFAGSLVVFPARDAEAMNIVSWKGHAYLSRSVKIKNKYRTMRYLSTCCGGGIRLQLQYWLTKFN